eukprot:6011772-Pyramimonas_sp.AAC.1
MQRVPSDRACLWTGSVSRLALPWPPPARAAEKRFERSRALCALRQSRCTMPTHFIVGLESAR